MFVIFFVILRPDYLLFNNIIKKISKMKKYLLIASVTLTLTLTACSGGQKTAPAATDETAAPAVTATTDSTTVKADTAAVKVDSANVQK